MSQSIIEVLAMVSDALATVAEPKQLTPVAVGAIAKALGCESADLWLFVREPRWLTHLKQVPGVEQVVQTFGSGVNRIERLRKKASHREAAQLRLASTSNRRPRVPQSSADNPPSTGVALSPSTSSGPRLSKGSGWRFDRLKTLLRPGSRTERTTLAALTDGQVTTVAELAAMPSRALQVNGSDSGEDVCLVAGLFHADEPVGVLACTWAGTGQADASDARELLVVCVANYLGQMLGGGSAPGHQGRHRYQTELYLAGTGLLLTALDAGPPDAKACAEAVVRCALELAANESLRPAQIRDLQWAALFHEVGRAPMDRWLTFPAPGNGDGAGESESADPLCLTLIPNLEAAASLLTQVAPVLDGRNGHPGAGTDLDSNVDLPAKLLATACLSSQCRKALPSAEAELSSSDGETPQTEEPWDTHSPHIETSIPEDLTASAPETI